MADHIHDTSSLDKATAYRIHRTARMLRVHLNKTFQKLGLDISMEQWFILFRLYERSGQSQSELADKDLNDHPNITRMIDALEKRQLVKREADPDDRRRHLISLTEEGQQLMLDMMPVVVEVREQVFGGIPQSDIDFVIATLDKIEANLAVAI